MDPILTQLSATLPAAQSIEQLARPLLVMLGESVGLESTYLTTVDLDAGLQQVRYARNTGELQIPEGLSVPWGDTLCKRALDEGVMATGDVAERWGDSEAARALGIRTYVSAPIRGGDGELLGTLCAASARQQPISEQGEALLRLFSNLVASFLERDRLLARLRAANEQLSAHALSDALTGLPNRRALEDELQRLLARAVREGSSVLVGLIDLDGFKRINDEHGHQAGDRFLQAIAQRLAGGLRSTDMLGRLGGDEFLLIGPGPALSGPSSGALLQAGDAWLAAQSLEQRFGETSRGDYRLGDATQIAYGGASAGFVALDPRALSAAEAVRLADARMYEVKRQRREAAHG